MAKRTFRGNQLRISTLDYKTMEYIEKMRNSSVRIEAGKMRLDVAIADDGQSVDIILCSGGRVFSVQPRTSNAITLTARNRE